MTTYEVAESQVAEMPWVLSLPLSDRESEVVSVPDVSLRLPPSCSFEVRRVFRCGPEVRVPVGNRVSVSQRVARERHQPPLPLSPT